MKDHTKNRPAYLAKKHQYDNMITLYGRNPVLEILSQPDIEVHKLHLAKTNNTDGIIGRIVDLANDRNVEVRLHSRQELSRISRNSRQDQGVAVDLVAPGYQSLTDMSAEIPVKDEQLMLLDRVTNPQNIGMIIRSVAASPFHGLILPRAGSAKIDPLVFKASAGNLLKATIYHCHDSLSAIHELKNKGFRIIGLDARGDHQLSQVDSPPKSSQVVPGVWVLGNETTGLCEDVLSACDQLVSIPMANNVESLNVSATATLVAFHNVI